MIEIENKNLTNLEMNSYWIVIKIIFSVKFIFRQFGFKKLIDKSQFSIFVCNFVSLCILFDIWVSQTTQHVIELKIRIHVIYTLCFNRSKSCVSRPKYNCLEQTHYSLPPQAILISVKCLTFLYNTSLKHSW